MYSCVCVSVCVAWRVDTPRLAVRASPATTIMDADTVFADGTPSDGKPFDMDSRTVRNWRGEYNSVTMKRRRKLAANPPASQIHKGEHGAPWRRKYDDEIMEERRIAEVEVQKKRVTLLSQQTCRGMMRVFGVRYDVTEFGNILHQAYKVRAIQAQKAAEAAAEAEATGTKAAEEDDDDDQSESDLKALQVLEAVLRFDVKKVVQLLELRPEDKSDKVLATRTVVLSGAMGE